MTSDSPTAITTFSPEYYEKWGREGLASLVRYWPGPIVAYYEHEAPAEFQDRVEYRDLFAQEECAHFIKWTSMVPLLQGILPTGEYHYNFNAHKFGRKVFAITDYALERKPFYFIGADVRALKLIPPEFLHGLMDGFPGVFLLRRHMGMHVESDFAGYDPRERRMRHLLKAYRKCFTSGSFLELRGWHDCSSLDQLLDLLGLAHEVNNLSKDVKGDGRLGLNVWPKTVLSEYMVHLKGMLKKGGKAA